jgi:succinate dehydrogenase / fumarate reductase cytochrome b subunit
MATAIRPKSAYRTNYAEGGGRALRSALGTTVGSKFVVALTGLLLVLFVIVHLLGNLLVFGGREAMNDYAAFLKSKGGVLWGFRVALATVFVVHVWLALKLKLRNVAARPVRYQVQRTIQASMPSLYMAQTGIVVLLFVLFHLAHFTVGVGSDYLTLRDAQGRHDVYEMVVRGFAVVPVAALYVLAQAALFWHLVHAVPSLFQSLGWSRPDVAPALRRLGVAVAGFVLLGNVGIPFAVWVGIVA